MFSRQASLRRGYQQNEFSSQVNPYDGPEGSMHTRMQMGQGVSIKLLVCEL